MIYIKELGNAFNRNFIVEERTDKTKWVGKISRSLDEKGVFFNDLDQRAILADRLLNILKIPTPLNKLIHHGLIHGLKLKKEDKNISDYVWLSLFSGVTLPEFLKNNTIYKIKNLPVIYDNIVFNIWIGNHDRKDYDCIVDKSNNLYFIDYHLWGPGFLKNELFSLGAYAESYNIEDSEDIGWCVESPQIINFIRSEMSTIKLFSKMISKINDLDINEIKKAIDNLNFTYENGKDMPNEFILEFLVRRKIKLEEAINSWIKKRYPKGNRPKNIENADSIYDNI